jgi:hypothetical protein
MKSKLVKSGKLSSAALFLQGSALIFSSPKKSSNESRSE